MSNYKSARDWAIFMNINNERYSDVERMTAIEHIAYAPTHNSITKAMMLDVIRYLIAKPELRLLTAEELQHLPDRATICVEQLLSREDEERGYITGKAWGTCSNRTCDEDGELIVSMLGTFLPNTITKIPYVRQYQDSNGVRRKHYYRFWTDRPTDEQSKEVPWDD